MKKRFLIIGLVVGLFLVLGSGAAMALAPHDDKVPLWNGPGNGSESFPNVSGYTEDPTNGYFYPTLYLYQSKPNAPYWVDDITGLPIGKDAIPLVVEGKKDGTYDPDTDSEATPLNSILVIRNWGGEYKGAYQNPQIGEYPNRRESELRFDNGISTPSDYSPMQATIYTWGDDHTLRLKPGPFGTEKGQAEIRIKKTNGDIAAQITAKTAEEASLDFVTAEGRGDTGTVTAKIYRPANYDYLKVEPGEKLEVEGDILLPKTGTPYPNESDSYGLKFTGSYYDAYNTWEEVETTYTLRNTIGSFEILYYDNYGGVTSEEKHLLRLDSSGNIWIKGQYLNIESYSTIEDNSIRLSTSQYTSSYFNGRLGIGTVSPGEKLEVNGNIKASGYKSSDGSAGLTQTINLIGSDGNSCTLTVKNGLITGTDCP